VDINGGLTESGNPIVGSPIDLGGGSNTILEIVVGLTQSYKTGFGVRIILTYKHIIRLSLIQCGTLNNHFYHIIFLLFSL